MDNSVEKCIVLMNEGLKKKNRYLQDLYELTVEQTSAISSEDIEGLNRLVGSKQEKIDAIDKLDEEFKLNFKRLKSMLGVSSLDGIDAGRIEGARELKDRVADILSIVKKISDLEGLNSAAAKKLLNSLGNEVKKLNQGLKISNVYAPVKIERSSYFIDKKK